MCRQICLIFSLFALTACAVKPPAGPQFASAGPFYAPSTATFHPHAPLLPTSDTLAYDFPRGEKAAYGSYPLEGASAYTIYTFDAYPIGLPRGSGWQYRYTVRSGVDFP